jgi:hypothetical protein
MGYLFDGMPDFLQTCCDGILPGCKTCEVYNVACSYDRTPPMSQVTGMAKRLQDAEQTIAQLRDALENANVQREMNYQRHALGNTCGSSHRSSPGAVANRFHNCLQAAPDSSSRADAIASSVIEAELPSDLSLDEHGEVCVLRLLYHSSPRTLCITQAQLCYYGPTSAVHAPPPGSADNEDLRTTSSNTTMLSARLLLQSAAIDSKTWEQFALGNAAIQTDISVQMLSRLLKIHWVWISPMSNWVYRPAFMRE